MRPCFFIVCCCLFFLNPEPLGAARQASVFVLHSYSQEYAWTSGQHEGFMRRIAAEGLEALTVGVEYLDTKRVAYTPAYADFMTDYLVMKYQGFQTDIIYVTDDNALGFALSHLPRVFPDIPVFFSGVNDYQVLAHLPPDRVTGVFERKEIIPNLALARRLLPELSDILVIGDASETFQAARREIEADLKQYPDVHIRFLSNDRIEPLVASLEGAAQRFAFLSTIGRIQDAQHHVLTLHQTISAITGAGPIVVWSMEDVYVRDGVLGGYVTSGPRQGETAAQLAIRYLYGEAVDKILPVEASPNAYVFDGRELKRSGLRLPVEIEARAVILNPQPTFFERHLQAVVGALYGLVVLFVISLAISLFVVLRQKRRIIESEERWQFALEGAGDGVWDWNAETNEVFFSRQWKAMLGFEEHEIGNTLEEWSNRVHPEDRDRVNDEINKHFAGQSPVYMSEHRVQGKDGNYKWILDRGKVIQWSGEGKPLRVIGTHADISERKRAEEALRESEARFKALSTGIIDAVLVHMRSPDHDGRTILEANEAACRMFGYTHAELLGMTVSDLGGQDRTVDRRRIRQELDAGREIFYELTHVKKDGTRFRVEIHAQAFDYQGRQAVLAILRDLSERIRTEEALRESEERFRNIYNKSPIAIGLYNHEGILIDVNPACCDLLGIASADAMQGFNFFDDPSLPADQRELLQTGETVRYQAVLDFDLVSKLDLYKTKRSGKARIDVVITPIRKGRQITHEYVVQIVDVTEHRRLEEQLRQALKMEAVGRLAGGVAHDFNNLLSPIIGYGEMLQQDIVEGDPRKAPLDQIVHAGLRARDLVRQLLAFSRKQVLAYKLVELNHVVTGLDKLLRRTIPEDIKIEVVLSSDSLPVMADIGQIEQVLINLATNAADAMPEGGSITIETAAAHLDGKYAGVHDGVAPGAYAMLAVSDTGCGVDEATREHLFEPFFSTKGEKGTGLGLATVYGIVKQHDGNVWVYSEPDKGTTFKIFLPLSEAIPHEDESIAKSVADLTGNETILLVEDNRDVRELTLAILRRQGYTVLTAENGREALAIMERRESPLHLLLTDVVMPEMNGKELYARAAEKHSHLKVLYMSGYTDDVIAHRGVLDEGVAFIQKPFSVSALAAKVRQTLDQ